MHEVFILDRPERVTALRLAIDHWLDFFAKGLPLIVTIEIPASTKKRTAAQNAAYWALLREVASSSYVGGRRFDADIWHEFFAGKFLGRVDSTLPGGEVITRPISTATLDKAAFADYLEKVERFALDQLTEKAPR